MQFLHAEHGRYFSVIARAHKSGWWGGKTIRRQGAVLEARRDGTPLAA